MHPIEKLCEEYGVTRYWLANKGKISQSGLSDSVVKNRSIDEMKLGTFRKLAIALNIDVDLLIKKMYEYEKMVDKHATT